MNRGLSRRPLFESKRDERMFLALLACAVRDYRIELHAFCLMTTHFHLLLRGLDGDLAGTMRWVQSQYARYFNRTRGRDGPLVRGRFRSIPVTTIAYLVTVIRYIDANPVQAGLAPHAMAYPAGSAPRHAAPRRPRWLDPRLVDQFLRPWLRAGLDRTAAYRKVFSTLPDDPSLNVARARLERGCRAEDELDSARLWSSKQRRAWIRQRALQGDGVLPATALVDVRSLCATVALHRKRSPNTRAKVGSKTRGADIWRMIEAGLLRDLCGATFVGAASAMATTPSNAHRLYCRHRDAVEHDEVYVTFAAEVARQALARCYDSLPVQLVDDAVAARLLGKNP